MPHSADQMSTAHMDSKNSHPHKRTGDREKEVRLGEELRSVLCVFVLLRFRLFSTPESRPARGGNNNNVNVK